MHRRCLAKSFLTENCSLQTFHRSFFKKLSWHSPESKAFKFDEQPGGTFIDPFNFRLVWLIESPTNRFLKFSKVWKLQLAEFIRHPLIWDFQTLEKFNQSNKQPGQESVPESSKSFKKLIEETDRGSAKRVQKRLSCKDGQIKRNQPEARWKC